MREFKPMDSGMMIDLVGLVLAEVVVQEKFELHRISLGLLDIEVIFLFKS